MPGGAERYYPHFANLYRCTPLPGLPFAAGHRTHCLIKYSFVSADTGQEAKQIFI